MPDLETLMEEAYSLFAPYTIGSTLCVCKACCVTDAEEQALVAAPLRQVSCELLQYGYFDSVCYHSDREHWELKHFLPRVLELVSQFEFPRFTPEVLFDRLDFDQPTR